MIACSLVARRLPYWTMNKTKCLIWFSKRVQDPSVEGAREQIPRLSITAAVWCLRRQLELAAQHADNVVGGDDAGELVVIVDHR